MGGYLEVTFGPMFSGKTTSLIHKANTFIKTKLVQNKEIKVLIINHKDDVRETETEDGLTPHIQSKIIDCDKTSMKVKTLSDIDVSLYNYILVDESQFFEDLVTSVMGWLSQGKHVHCCGLLTDSNRHIFGDLHELIPRADNVEHLKALCFYCGDKTPNAPFTKCIDLKDSQILIGGSGKYIPVCGKHF